VSDVLPAVLRTLSGCTRPRGILVGGVAVPARCRADPPSLADAADRGPPPRAPLPDDLDGRVMSEALAPEWIAAHPVQTASREGGAGSA
jgi:hypothetical protein